MSDYVHSIGDDESAKIRQFLLWLAAGTVAFGVLVIVAVISADRWLLFISHESERQFIEPYIQWSGGSLLIDADPVLQDYVDELANQVAGEFDLDDELHLEFRVVEGESINAFAMLGGYIFVFEGLLRVLDNENSLAMVLAHEISHAHNRDPLLSAGRGMIIEMAIASVSGSGIDPGAINTGTDLMLNAYSREQEETADQLALGALQRRYQHIGGATDLFTILQDSGEAVETVDILSTHPNLDFRIQALESLADEFQWKVGPTTPYPSEINDILENRR